jgi:hypothetical protein
MPSMGFVTAIPAMKQLQAYALDHMASGLDSEISYLPKYKNKMTPPPSQSSSFQEKKPIQNMSNFVQNYKAPFFS